jgi:hypothetical protein
MRRMRPAGGIENFRRPDKKDNKQQAGPGAGHHYAPIAPGVGVWD